MRTGRERALSVLAAAAEAEAALMEANNSPGAVAARATARDAESRAAAAREKGSREARHVERRLLPPPCSGVVLGPSGRLGSAPGRWPCQVSCGARHTLVLCDGGAVYSMGAGAPGGDGVDGGGGGGGGMGGARRRGDTLSDSGEVIIARRSTMESSFSGRVGAAAAAAGRMLEGGGGGSSGSSRMGSARGFGYDDSGFIVAEGGSGVLVLDREPVACADAVCALLFPGRDRGAPPLPPKRGGGTAAAAAAGAMAKTTTTPPRASKSSSPSTISKTALSLAAATTNAVDARLALSLISRAFARRVVCLSAGSRHSAMCTGDGLVFTMGDGRHGRLGHGSEFDAAEPTCVAALAGVVAGKGGGGVAAAVSPNKQSASGETEGNKRKRNKKKRKGKKRKRGKKGKKWKKQNADVAYGRRFVRATSVSCGGDFTLALDDAGRG